MTNTTSTKRYLVTINEWLSHTILVEAEDEDAARDAALDQFAENNEDPAFSCLNGGIDEVFVHPAPSP